MMKQKIFYFILTLVLVLFAILLFAQTNKGDAQSLSKVFLPVIANNSLDTECKYTHMNDNPWEYWTITGLDTDHYVYFKNTVLQGSKVCFIVLHDDTWHILTRDNPSDAVYFANFDNVPTSDGKVVPGNGATIYSQIPRRPAIWYYLTPKD